MEAVTLTSVLENIGTFFTSAVGWLGTALDTVMDSPALFIMVIAMPVAGFGVGLLKRLLNL